MENFDFTENLSSSSASVKAIEAALAGQFAPRAINAAATLFRRHPVIFVAGLVVAAMAWKKFRDEQQRSSAPAPTDPADLVH